MSFEIHEHLRRQAEWQRSRKDLPWPDKIRMVEKVRDSVCALRATADKKVCKKSRRSHPPLSKR